MNGVMTARSASMEVVSVLPYEHSVEIETTGSRIRFEKGCCVATTLWPEERQVLRLVSKRIHLPTQDDVGEVQASFDSGSIIVRDDSSIVIRAQQDQVLELQAPFQPGYVGKDRSGLIVADEAGGFGIYQSGQKLRLNRVGERDWKIGIRPGEELWISLFPPILFPVR